MEFIKKTILQSTTTGKTDTTKDNEYIIIPDTGVTYYMKICLKSTVKDIGFFNAYDPTTIEDNEIPPTTLEPPTILPLIEYCYRPRYDCGDQIHEISGHEPYTSSIKYWDEYGNEHIIYGCRVEINITYTVNSSNIPITIGMVECV